METKEKKDNKDLWKIIAMLLLGVLIGIFFGMKVLSAIELDLNKNQSCQLFNYSGIECDSFWCIAGLKGNWTIDEICIINGTIIDNSTNETNITNQTYYNETYLIELMRNVSMNYSNEAGLINASTLIMVKNAILDGEQNRTEQYAKSYIDQNSGSQVIQTQPVPGWAWIVLVLGVCFAGVAVFYIKSKNINKIETDFDNYREPSIKNSYKPTAPYKSPNVKPEQVRGNVRPQYKPLDKDKREDLARTFDEDATEEEKGELR